MSKAILAEVFTSSCSQLHVYRFILFSIFWQFWIWCFRLRGRHGYYCCVHGIPFRRAQRYGRGRRNWSMRLMCRMHREWRWRGNRKWGMLFLIHILNLLKKWNFKRKKEPATGNDGMERRWRRVEKTHVFFILFFSLFSNQFCPLLVMSDFLALLLLCHHYIKHSLFYCNIVHFDLFI